MADKLEMLVSITERGKANNLISEYEKAKVACSLVVLGNGTANSEVLKALGLSDIKKDIVISIIRSDMIETAFKMVEKQINGIAFTIPLSSMVGVSLYNFLKGETKNG